MVTPPAPDDPMERLIWQALVDIGADFETDPRITEGLDFVLAGGIHIEVKRFHAPRIAAQMSRVEDVIAVQGERAVTLLASLIRVSGTWSKGGLPR